METEDDMIVLVVVDDENNSKNDNFRLPEIKQEPECSSEDPVELDNIIETAEKHGEFVALKIEPNDYEYDEYLEDEALQRVLKSEYTDEQYENNNNSTDYIPKDEEYVPEYEDDNHNEVQDNTFNTQQDTGRHRFTMLKPWQQRSFVAELRQEYPELRDDEELLINTLEQIMRSVKPPPPPKDFYIMNGILFECVHCGSLSETIPAAGRHYQEKHGQRYLVCYACGVDFRSTTNLYKHEKRCVAPDALLVLKARAVCIGRRGRGRPNLQLKSYNSKTNKANKARFPCQLCSAVFMTRSNLQSHENLHRGERPFRCQLCPCAYTSYSALSRHTKKHMDVQFICDHCSRSFKIKAALVSHMDTHKPYRKHGCTECPRRFAQKSALILHINKIHRKLPPPCACQICPKRYPRMSLLKAHMKRAHGMSIITRKMFFKSLPTMSELEIKQSKVILKSVSNFEYETIHPVEGSVDKFHDLKTENDEENQDIDCVKIAEQMYQQSMQQTDTEHEEAVDCVKLAEQASQEQPNGKIEVPDESNHLIGEFLHHMQRMPNSDSTSASVSEFVQYIQSDNDCETNIGTNVIYIQNGEVAHQMISGQENLVLEVMVDNNQVLLENRNEGAIQTLVTTE